MSIESISDYWNYFILAPVGFVSAKIFSINSKVNVHETKLETLKEGLDKLCEKHDETNNLLRELNGKFEGYFRHD